ncbi:MAG: hypothetical protein AAFX00_00605 [Pseudomonadota bacterium]
MASRNSIRLLLVGSGPRLVAAALVTTALWALFFWATASPGAL